MLPSAPTRPGGRKEPLPPLEIVRRAPKRSASERLRIRTCASAAGNRDEPGKPSRRRRNPDHRTQSRLEEIPARRAFVVAENFHRDRGAARSVGLYGRAKRSRRSCSGWASSRSVAFCGRCRFCRGGAVALCAAAIVAMPSPKNKSANTASATPGNLAHHDRECSSLPYVPLL